MFPFGCKRFQCKSFRTITFRSALFEPSFEPSGGADSYYRKERFGRLSRLRESNYLMSHEPTLRPKWPSGMNLQRFKGDGV